MILHAKHYTDKIEYINIAGPVAAQKCWPMSNKQTNGCIITPFEVKYEQYTLYKQGMVEIFERTLATRVAVARAWWRVEMGKFFHFVNMNIWWYSDIWYNKRTSDQSILLEGIWLMEWLKVMHKESVLCSGRTECTKMNSHRQLMIVKVMSAPAQCVRTWQERHTHTQSAIRTKSTSTTTCSESASFIWHTEQEDCRL